MLVPWSIIQVVVGQVKPRTPTAPVFWTTIALVVALLLGALVIAFVDRWRKRRSDRLSPGEQLSHFRSLYEKGELSREEFERIRTLLGGRLREELDLPPAKPSAEPPPAATATETGIQALDDRLQPPPPGPATETPGPPPPPPAPPDGPTDGPPAA
jgi:hypothetical protein